MPPVLNTNPYPTNPYPRRPRGAPLQLTPSLGALAGMVTALGAAIRHLVFALAGPRRERHRALVKIERLGAQQAGAVLAHADQQDGPEEVTHILMHRRTAQTLTMGIDSIGSPRWNSPTPRWCRRCPEAPLDPRGHETR